MADREKAKKQVPLRLSASLYDELARWAEDEFRSVNGQIEYLLTEAVPAAQDKAKGRVKGGGHAAPLIFYRGEKTQK